MITEREVEALVVRQASNMFYGRRKFCDDGNINGKRFGPLVDRDSNDKLKNIRLDFEFDGIDLTEMEESQVSAEIFYHITRDLVDMFWNGDTNSTDPLLKTVDGFKKNPNRDKPILTNGLIYREFRPMRDAVEYTIFMLVNR